jgi:hypothetical protein
MGERERRTWENESLVDYANHLWLF